VSKPDARSFGAITAGLQRFAVSKQASNYVDPEKHHPELIENGGLLQIIQAIYVRFSVASSMAKRMAARQHQP